LYKAFFIGTPFGEALKNLKMSKAVPDRLELQECERESHHVKLLILCIPEKDELQEAVETSISIKLTVPTKVEL
jgi:hypothetical protein